MAAKWRDQRVTLAVMQANVDFVKVAPYRSVLYGLVKDAGRVGNLARDYVI